MRWRDMHSTRTRFGYFLVPHNPSSFDPIFRLYKLATSLTSYDSHTITELLIVLPVVRGVLLAPRCWVIEIAA
jgi:hypothetical protein